MNKELFARKTGMRHIPIAQPIIPRPAGLSEALADPTTIQQLDPSLTLERFDPDILWPGRYKFCGLKEGCWEKELL